MTQISMIAAIDEANGLGYNNQLLCHLPVDLQHFKTLTMGKPIIMGRKTFASIGRALPGRLNVVLTRTQSELAADVVVCSSLTQSLKKVQDYPEAMIIGGEQLFAEGMNYASRLYLTHIHHRFTADVFFPKIDEKLWSCVSKEFRSRDEKNEYDLTFCTYERIITL